MAKIPTFTAKFQRPGQEPRYIPHAAIYNGYLVVITQQGRGRSWEEGGMTADGDGDTWTVWQRYEEVMAPRFDAVRVGAMRSEVEKLKTVPDVIAAGMEQYLLRFGEQEGYTITNYDQEKAQEIEDKKIVEFHSHPCWETGLTWRQLAGRYPEHVFNAMRPHLYYHNEQEEEEGDWKGWAISPENPERLQAALAKIGWKTNF